MASLFRRSSVFTCQVIQKCTSQNITKTLQVLTKHKVMLPLSTCGMTRNIHHLSSSKHKHHVIPSNIVSKSCTRCGVHNEGDAEFSKFLQSEIAYEKGQETSTIEMKGWHVSGDGADVTLSKTSGNETIKVMFNVNNSVDEEQPEDARQKDDKVKMVSKPPFTVEIKKSSGKVLSASCSFVGADDFETPPEGEPVDDQFTIDEVCLHDGELKESVFSISSETMDGTLYDMLMDMLHDRGIGDDFAKSLIDFSTSYEQGKYIDFLDEMKSFVEEK